MQKILHKQKFPALIVKTLKTQFWKHALSMNLKSCKWVSKRFALSGSLWKGSFCLIWWFSGGIENQKIDTSQISKNESYLSIFATCHFSIFDPPEKHQIKQNGPQSSLKLICGISNSYSKLAFKPLFWVFLQSRLEISACVEFSAFDSQMKFCRKWRFWKILPAL